MVITTPALRQRGGNCSVPAPLVSLENLLEEGDGPLDDLAPAAGSVKEQHLAALGMAQEADFRDIGEPLDILQDGHRAPVGLGVEPFRKGDLERKAAFRPPDRVFPGRNGEGREAQGEREERTFHIHSV